ncbi:hypothetical protein OBBRIDRAFT_787500 [Obba rivulosa]|uniref:Ima1 N-terminal domain-containing protein n=1 Tax=Obba rivulosa TaxID=1052685 RepID=A0A8E2DU71_9APHY|nr:hypothetical protein OBBRIDRAFT_787500 [Obba rivulosa]
MSKIFRRQSCVVCFYCQSTITPIPRNPRSFRCPTCDCWNRFDKNGEIISDEPAMHDENLNARSFAKRASPRKDRLPSSYGSAPFCHTCQTNQMLLANLLSNYLPPPDHPEYAQRSALLPEYQRSIEARYPPVCAACAPAVADEIKRRDDMARTRALGGFLRASKQGRVSGSEADARAAARRSKERLEREIAAWKIRGCLWVAGLAYSLTGHAAVAFGYSILRIPDIVCMVMPLVVFTSILWTAWDPTYASYQRAQFQGRTVRVRGKTEYNVLQMIAWLSRFITSISLAMSYFEPSWDFARLSDEPTSQHTQIYCSVSLVLELLVLASSYLVLQLQRPPAVRLMDTTSHERLLSPTPSVPPTRSTTPAVPPPESDLLAGLSLSNKPIITSPSPINPVFGLPSLPIAKPVSPPRPPSRARPKPPRSPNAMDIEEDEDAATEEDSDAMDWDPLDPASPQRARTNDDGTWLRPQRFFAPEEPTGLENLFAKTIRLADDDEQSRSRSRATQTRALGLRSVRTWILLCAIVFVPVAGIVYRVWDVRRKRASLIP